MLKILPEYIWKVSSLIIGLFVCYELIVVSPILLLSYGICLAARSIAPDVFEGEFMDFKGLEKSRKILLCVDETSFSSINWVTRDFIKTESDCLIVTHVVEQGDSIKIPVSKFSFDKYDIDSKDFFIPQYLSELCHWLGRNSISYEGIIVMPDEGSSVSDSIIKLARKCRADCIIASTSKRIGTTDIGNTAFQIALRSDTPTIIVK